MHFLSCYIYLPFLLFSLLYCISVFCYFVSFFILPLCVFLFLPALLGRTGINIKKKKENEDNIFFMFQFMPPCAQEVLFNICQILIHRLFHEDKLAVKIYSQGLQLTDLVSSLFLKIQLNRSYPDVFVFILKIEGGA